MSALAVAGMVAGAGAAAAAVAAPGPRVRAAGMLATLAIAPVLLAAEVWDAAPGRELRDRPAAAGLLLVVGLGVVAALAVLLARRPAALPVLVVAALPFRVPVAVGGTTANLLVPLYLVIAAGVLAHALPVLRDGPVRDPGPRPQALEVLVAVVLVLFAVAAGWTSDVDRALQQAAFFYLPFALLLGLLREVVWTRAVVRACLAVLVALALVFVAVGFVEYARKELFLNPDPVLETQFEAYFRVSSLFFDPNIYGRFLVMVMLALAVVVLWRRRSADVLAAAALLAVLWAGLVVTFSQSSFTALLAGLAVLAGLRWGARTALAVTAALVALGAVVVVAAPDRVGLDLSSSASADRATSGRLDLVEGGVDLFAAAPVLGHGSASFVREFRRREGGAARRAVAASHTIPVTVAAEQGVVGLAAYLALLVAALARLGRGAAGDPVRAFVAAAFVALVVHTMLYAAFLEDPLTWALLGAGIALAPAPAAASRARVAQAAPARAAAT